MGSHRRHRLLSFLVICAVLFSNFASHAAFAQTGATPSASPIASPAASPVAEDSAVGSLDLDVLVIGAHPDDEAFGLSTYGQWNEYNNIRTGVITVTRGEGGGNAVGTEEGPALGILREAEERKAVSRAGIEHIFNLDKVDFYYTVSAPLTEETWGYDDTLARVVRIIRETKPEVIITMNPAPIPGNHGHHQMAARFAVAGYYAAADPSMFPEQITREGLSPWSASKIFMAGASGKDQVGENCASTFQPVEPTNVIDGVWDGRVSDRNNGLLWSQVARSSQKMYASQGWAVFPDASSDPKETGCSFFTLIDSRVPYTLDNTGPTAMLEGAIVPGADGLPLGTQFYLTTDTFDVIPGADLIVTAHVAHLPIDASPEINLDVPDGWMVGALGAPLEPDGNGGYTVRIGVKVAENAKLNTRFRLAGTLTAGAATGSTVEVVQVVPPVRGVLAPLPQVAQFEAWTTKVGAPQLDNLIKPVASLGSGESREITVALSNRSARPQTGTVALALPAGFTADATSKPYPEISAGGSESVSFTVTNTNAALLSGKAGGVDGDYDMTISTESGGVTSAQTAGLELVPMTDVAEVKTDPKLDGIITSGEYLGDAVDLNSIWEGDDLESAGDGGGIAHIAWGVDGIYVAVQVKDDTLGAVVPEADAKRHWRTDSVEIAIDPRGTAENTSATFKVGVFPTTTEGQPAAYRDADAFQGPVSETAPGFRVASKINDPYNGYVVETFIPFADLPADIDPKNAAMNIFIYDSDTQDLTGQTRLGWSTWGGVQGDPYRWGKTRFEGYTPPADARTTPDAPKMPLDATHSIDSPQSIMQSAMDGVGLAGTPSIPASEGLLFVSPPKVEGDKVSVSFTAKSAGTVTIFDDAGGIFDTSTPIVVQVTAGQELVESVPRAENNASGTLLISFQNATGETQAFSRPYSD